MSSHSLSLAFPLEFVLLLLHDLRIDLGAPGRLVAVHPRRRRRVLLERGDLGGVLVTLFLGLLLGLDAVGEGTLVLWAELVPSITSKERKESAGKEGCVGQKEGR